MTPAVVRARDLWAAYPRGLFARGRPKPVLRGVSLTIPRGETHGLVGESGSGKSTLGRVVLGFLGPSAGEIETCGTVPHRAAPRAFRRKAQVVFQDSASALNPRMTLGRSVAEGLAIHGADRRTIQAEVPRLFDRVGLPSRLIERHPHEISGGQRQRVCIARALALEPELLVADEPVSALDVSVQAQILDLFASLRAEHGLTMLMITHDLDVVRELCGRVSVMSEGRIVEAGETEAVISRPQAPYTQRLIASVPGWG